MHAYSMVSFIPMCCRGESLCNDFLLHGEIRSITPSSTNVLARQQLRARLCLKQLLITTLHMRSTEVIVATTERPNIFLSVVEKKGIIQVVQDMTQCEDQFTDYHTFCSTTYC